MREAEVLLKLAKGQRDRHKLTARLMKADKSDGIRWAGYLDKHDSVLRHIVHDCSGYSDITSEECDQIEELLNT